MKKLPLILLALVASIGSNAQDFPSKHLSHKTEVIINSGIDETCFGVFSNNNKTLALIDLDIIEFYHVKSGRLIRKINLHDSIDMGYEDHVTFSSDTILTITPNYSNYILNVTPSGKLSKIPRKYPDPRVVKNILSLEEAKKQLLKSPHFSRPIKFRDHFTPNSKDLTKSFVVKTNKNSKIIINYIKFQHFSVSLHSGASNYVIFDSINLPLSNTKINFSKNDEFVLIDNYVFNTKTYTITKLKRVNSSFKSIPIGMFNTNNVASTFNINKTMFWSDRSFSNHTSVNPYSIKPILSGFIGSSYEKNRIIKRSDRSLLFNDLALVSYQDLGPSYTLLSVSENGNYGLFINLMPATYKVLNLNTGAILHTIKSVNKYCALSGNHLLINENEKVEKINLITSQKAVLNLKKYHITESQTQFHFLEKSSSRYVVKTHENSFKNTNDTVYVWDLFSGKLIVKFYPEDSKNRYTFFDIDSVHNEVTFIKRQRTINIRDLNTGKIKYEFSKAKNFIGFVDHQNDQYLISSRDGSIYLWDKKNKSYTVRVIQDFDEFVFLTPEKYYLTSKEMTDKIHFVREDEIYLFEQFDLKYNRPDIILDRLGYADSSLVQAYHKAYLKRLKKMNFTEDMLEDDFHLPEIKIENFEKMPTLNEDGKIELNLNIEDTKYKLDRINVWINDVAIYGSNGINLRDKNVQQYKTILPINLALGDNKIQVSVLNQAGAESYKETVNITSTFGKKQPDLYLIAIGESEFQQTEFNLTYAAKDAKDMTNLFKDSKAFKNVFTKTLTNNEVTANSVKDLKSFLAQADINDQVMIFIAGHGVLNEDLDYFFATYDMDFNNPKEKGLAYEDLEGLLDGIKPLKKTLLIDACHSGEIDKDDVELAISDEKEDENIQFRAVGNSAKPKLGMENTSELTKSLFTDLRKGTGATVISSAGGMEFAMESDQWKNGLFTYCMLMGIKSGKADKNKDGEIWLSELKEYISEKVIELSNGKQQPTSRIENQSVDFRVW